MGEVHLELEHAIGFSGAEENALWMFSDGDRYLYPSGACLVIAKRTDPHNQIFLRGHDDDVSAATMSRSAKLAASGQIGDHADVVVWDLEKQQLLYRFEEHDHGVPALAFSWDEWHDRLVRQATVATGGSSGIRWNGEGCVMKARQYLTDLKRRETGIYQCAVAGRGGVCLGFLNPLTGETQWNKVATSNDARDRDCRCVLFSGDNMSLFAGASSGELMWVDVRKQRVLKSQFVAGAGVTSLAWVMEDQLLVGDGDGTVHWFGVDFGTGALVELRRRPLHGGVTSLSIAPPVAGGAGGGTWYGLAGTESCRMFFLTGTIAPRQNRAPTDDWMASEIGEHPGPCGSGAGDGVGRGGASAAAGMALDPAKGLIGIPSGKVVGVAFAPGISDSFVTAEDDNTVCIWDAGQYRALAKCTSRGAGHPTAVALTPDLALSGWENGKLCAFLAETGEPIWHMTEAHHGAVSSIAVARNERFFLSAGDSAEVRVWTMRTREMMSDLREHAGMVTRVLLYEDDTHALSCSRDKSLLCWDLATERRISSHTQRTGGLNDMALSHDQSLVLTVGQGRSLTLWDLREPQPVHGIPNIHGDTEPTCVAGAHDHPWVVTGGADSMLRLWDLRNGKCVQEGIGHSGRVRQTTFSPDDRQLVSVADDGCILVWNLYEMMGDDARRE